MAHIPTKNIGITHRKISAASERHTLDKQSTKNIERNNLIDIQEC